MDKSEIEQVAQKVNEGLLTPEQGARILMEIVYRHKALFGLKQLDEDQIIDFLIYQHPKLIKIFSIYNKSFGTFSSFLQGSVRGTYITWKKRMARRNALVGSITVSDEIAYEEAQSQYLLPEEEVIHKLDESKGLCASYEQEQKPLFRYPDGSLPFHLKNPLLEKARIDSLRKNAILILALKSSYYLDEPLLEKVSSATGYSVESLKLVRDELNKTLKNKINRRNACITCRNNSYYFHRKYLLESYRLNHDSSWAEFINTKYEKQTKTWIDKNRRLARKEYTVSATNRAVGKILGMDPRHIFYVIRQAKENMDIISLKEYHK